MAVQIGARIGIEGEAQYRTALSNIVNITKTLKNETEALKATFDKNSATIQQNKQYQDKLNESIKGVQQALKIQNAEIEKFNEKLKSGQGLTEKEQAALNKFEVAVSNNKKELELLNQELRNTPSNLELVRNAFDNAQNSLTEWGSLAKDVGSILTRYISVPLAGMGVAGVKSAVDWETNLTSVKKTVEEVVDENNRMIYSYDQLDKDLREIGKRTGATYEQIAAAAEVAGQLGIAGDEVAGFTEQMIKLGDSTNLSADEAATYIARILNITNKGMPVSTEQARKFGSALVYLGNNFATTESEIALMTNRLAAGGTVAGLTTADILGLATAMSAVGIRAEAGGTAMTQTLTAIEKAVVSFSTGSTEKLEKIAAISGTTAEEFAKSWKENPIEAVKSFMTGLGGLEEQGESMTLVLDDLGMSGIRQANMLKSLSLASDMLTEAVDKSNVAWSGTTDYLDEEAQKRYETVAVKFQQMKNAFQDVGIVIGETLLPMVEKLTQWATDFANWFTNLDEGSQQFIISIGGIVAAIGPLLLIGGNLLIFFGKMKEALTVLGVGSGAGSVGSLTNALTGDGGLSAAISGATESLTASNGFIPTLLSIAPALLSTVGIVGLFGYTVHEVLSANEEKTWEWAAEMEEAFTDAEGNLLDFDAMAGWTTEDWIEYNKQQREAMKETKDSVIDDITAIKDGQVEKMAEIKGIIPSEFKGVMVDMQDSSNGAKDVILGNSGAMTYGLTQDIIQTHRDVSEQYRGMSQDAQDSVSDMANGISAKAPEVNRAMVAVVDTAAKPVGDLKGSAWSWGSDMMDNMASGIDSKIWWVQSKISALADKIRSYLHFSEPDVGPLSDFNTYMPDMMSQMAKGISDNTYLVEDAIKGVAGTMSYGIQDYSLPQNQSTSTFNSNDSIVINVYGAEGQSSRALANEIERVLAERMNNRKAVFGQ